MNDTPEDDRKCPELTGTAQSHLSKEERHGGRAYKLASDLDAPCRCCFKPMKAGHVVVDSRIVGRDSQGRMERQHAAIHLQCHEPKRETSKHYEPRYDGVGAWDAYFKADRIERAAMLESEDDGCD